MSSTPIIAQRGEGEKKKGKGKNEEPNVSVGERASDQPVERRSR